MKITLDDYFCNPKNATEFIYSSSRQQRVTADEFYSLLELEQENGYIKMHRITCNDGFSFSVQASQSHYCTPRVTHRNKNINIYDEYEVGFPSKKEDLLMEWCDDSEKPTDTIYAYVPKEVIEAVIEKHGGIK